MKWILKNERGFTLIETLISLLISSFVLLLLTGGILQVIAIRDTITSNAQENNRSNVITGDRQVEWHIFLNQLENYLQGSYEPRVAQNHLQVKEAIHTVTGYREVLYSRDGNQVNFSRKTDNGNQRMLTGIKRIDFSREDGWLTLEIVFINGDRYSGKIWIESWVEKEEIEEEVEEEKNNEGLEEEEIADEETGNNLFEEKETKNEESEEEVSEAEIIEDEIVEELEEGEAE